MRNSLIFIYSWKEGMERAIMEVEMIGHKDFVASINKWNTKPQRMLIVSFVIIENEIMNIFESYDP